MNTPSRFHLAQVNIAVGRGTVDQPVMAGFVAQLDRINALAEQSPGFVWRMKDGEPAAQYMAAYDGPTVIVNLSVWQDVDALAAYSYHSAHAEVLRRRRQWFERMNGPHLALWWIPACRLPTVAEATARLQHLARHGPGPAAFTLKERWPPPLHAEMNYHRRRFVTVQPSDTGDAGAGTQFEYQQTGAQVRGTYRGPGVLDGTLVATATQDGVLDMSYRHCTVNGAMREGVCTSLPRLEEGGRVSLFESWRWSAPRTGWGVCELGELR